MSVSKKLGQTAVGQEKSKPYFSKIADLKGLEKKCLYKHLVKNIIWMDPKSYSKLSGDHFEYPYIILKILLVFFTTCGNVYDIRLLIDDDWQNSSFR